MRTWWNDKWKAIVLCVIRKTNTFKHVQDSCAVKWHLFRTVGEPSQIAHDLDLAAIKLQLSSSRTNLSPSFIYLEANPSSPISTSQACVA